MTDLAFRKLLQYYSPELPLFISFVVTDSFLTIIPLTECRKVKQKVSLVFSHIWWLLTVHNCSSKVSPTSLMSEFHFKPPAETGWDVAGKHHQPATCTWQPETKKHHLALFFGCMLRKVEEEATWPHLPCLCSVVPKMMAILKYHASVHTVDLYGTPFSPDLLIFASYNH